MIFIRPKDGAIGEALNAIAGCFATDLTDVERQYLHKRIAEEYAQLKRLEKSQAGTASRPSLSTLVIGASTKATDQEADAKRNGGDREGALLDHHT